jgi:hypothetical protein
VIELAGYEITETLYDGRATAVYRATGPLGESVLKCLVAPYPTAHQIDAYRSEFAILSRIESPGILRARELREVGNGLVLVTESVGVPTLRDAIRRGPMPVKKFLDFARRLVAT